MNVLRELQAMVECGAARWVVDDQESVHLVLLQGAAFAMNSAHMTRIR